ncbi:polysaccharide biosynthesis C-terminal domain-containing protein [uncultured Algoriphagus sp.]|uniref:lipopolysaccharide biosynthesis protein n=1 Tax=uncultured Algoriphagus sp. TaxID=417365 RepID=UPI0030EEE731|tara:strand:- start:3069 stop:4460 length:1392 start_codon:yes stop_codon:yes gene_type:complete
MSKKVSLLRLSGVYMLGNVGSKILSFVLIFFMTYFLSKSEIGQYDLILTTISLIVPCVSILIDSALLRWLLDPQQEGRHEIIFQNIYGFLFLNIFIYSLGYWVFAYFIEFELSFWIYFYSVLMIIYPTMQQTSRGLGKNKLYASTSVIYSLLYVFFTCSILFFFNLGVRGVLMANIASLIIVISWLFLENGLLKYIKSIRLDKFIIFEFLKYSLPLLPNTLSWWLIGSSTRYVILAYLGSDYNGLFAISFKYPTILLILANVFTLAWQEKIIRTIDKVDAEIEFTKVLNNYVSLLMGLIIILSSTSKIIIGFIDESYYEAWKYIPILLLAVCIQAFSSFYGAAYLREKKTKAIFTSSLAGGLVTIGSSFYLVKFGLNGISLSILLGYVILLAFRVIHLKEFMNVKFPISKFIQLLIFFIIITGSLYLEQSWTLMYGLIIACLIFVCYNYTFIFVPLKNKLLKL